MSTPLKLRALSPKVLISLSPNNHFDYKLNKLSPTLRKSPGKSLSNVTKLHIPQPIPSSTPTKFNTASPIITFNLVDNKEQNRFFDALNINSPEQLQIQEEGLEFRRNLNVLGRGRFGTVIKGFYKGRTVAVKVIKLSPFNSDFLSESNAINLSNKYIVNTIDVRLNKSLNYAIILMDYLENCKNLHNVLGDCKLDRSNYIKYAMDICKGLSYCHSKNVFHMDLKPKNILISSEDVCKLCDFGNSFAEGTTLNYVHQGTVAYTCPEILMGEIPTSKCDVYSLGIILWQMKSGTMPYEDITAKEILIYKVVKFKIRPDVDDDDKSVDADIFNELYRKCWRCDPMERPHVSDVLLALKEIC